MKKIWERAVFSPRRICCPPFSLKNKAAVIYDAALTLISCCFASGSFSLMIFKFTKGRRRRGGRRLTIGLADISIPGQGILIYKIKSIRGPSRAIINGVGRLMTERKGSLSGTANGAVSRAGMPKVDCVVLCVLLPVFD